MILKNLFLDLQESKEVKTETVSLNFTSIEKAVLAITEAMKKGNKLIIFGNGGSAADSQHIAAEFVGRFQKERRALPAIALTTNSSILTALGNDYDYGIIFARQLEALAKPGDVVLGISTSGNSKNVIAGIQKAKELGLTYITLTGNYGGKLFAMGGINIDVPSTNTARIQESHIFIYHAICGAVEELVCQEN